MCGRPHWDQYRHLKALSLRLGCVLSVGVSRLQEEAFCSVPTPQTNIIYRVNAPPVCQQHAFLHAEARLQRSLWKAGSAANQETWSPHHVASTRKTERLRAAASQKSRYQFNISTFVPTNGMKICGVQRWRILVNAFSWSCRQWFSGWSFGDLVFFSLWSLFWWFTFKLVFCLQQQTLMFWNICRFH